MTVRSVYLDNAASTPVAPEVLEAMVPYFWELCGNPSSVHSPGQTAREAIEQARVELAQVLGCQPAEVYFTSGGTESDNQAIFGTAWTAKQPGHIITSAIEHHAVLHSCQWLEKSGWRVTYLPVDGTGMVDPDDVQAAICPDTALVTIMHANNEVGTVQPIGAIRRMCRDADVRFHTDAVQSVGHIPTRVDELRVDLLSVSGHKFNAPKGVGALYVRRGAFIAPLLHGGGHERGRRSGTENVPGIVGLGRASELARDQMGAEALRLARLRDRLIDGIIGSVPDAFQTGHRESRLPNNASMIFRGLDGELLLRALDAAGIAASSGSACTSGSLEPSHVLLAMGISPEDSLGSLRLSLGLYTSDADIDYVLEQLPKAVESARANSLGEGVYACNCADGQCCL
ncbi:MAG: cysteine desulfurase NifS [Dehalococcoidia bacterium]|nr:cysteine desulfurase NifS [Dehalococcoidia bacterium]